MVDQMTSFDDNLHHFARGLVFDPHGYGSGNAISNHDFHPGVASQGAQHFGYRLPGEVVVSRFGRGLLVFGGRGLLFQAGECRDRHDGNRGEKE